MDSLTAKPQRKRGRPSNKERQKLANGLSILEAMMALYEEGASDEEVIKLLRILPKDFEKKLASDKEFKAFVDAGRVAAKAWWLSLGRQCAKTKGAGDYSFWAANMDHRYGWKKTSAVTVEEKETTDPNALIRDVKSRLKRFSRTHTSAAIGEDELADTDVSRAN